KEARHLWYDFLRVHPVQFRRQKPFGRYIVDFYCADARLAIELDGSQHYEQEGLEYDRRRTVFLNRAGVAVLRFSNVEVMKNFQGVCTEIVTRLQERLEELGEW
ncbi:MAG: endonuclease domain-containing protein, partial [Oscillospiraceae bacterium]